MTYLSKNSFFLGLLFLLTSCLMKEPKPERLLPPEPVLIKGDMVIKKRDADKDSKKEEEMPLPPQTEEEAQRPLPLWAQAKGDGVYKLGKPYKVNGVWYFPAENPRYDEIGFAARYPKSFQGQRTANGEIYSKDLLTACHKTLPLPSIVQITNLANNKSIVVRINDRGPFVNDRLVDISDKAATLLELPEEGNAKVRIEIMNQESKTATSALHGAEKAVIPGPAYPPAVMKDPEAAVPVETKETFVTMSPSSAPEESNTETLFDATDTPLTPPAPENISPPPPSASPMAPVEQVSLPKKAYYIQAGVFGNRDNAKNLSDKLGSIGLVESTPITLNGRSLHRVRVGPFSSMEEADRALAQIKRHNLPDARLVAP